MCIKFHMSRLFKILKCFTMVSHQFQTCTFQCIIARKGKSPIKLSSVFILSLHTGLNILSVYYFRLHRRRELLFDTSPCPYAEPRTPHYCLPDQTKKVRKTDVTTMYHIIILVQYVADGWGILWCLCDVISSRKDDK